MADASNIDVKNSDFELTERDIASGAGAVTSDLHGQDIQGYTENDRSDMRRMGKRQVSRTLVLNFDMSLTTARSFVATFE
jgi:hypothetical protein